MTEKWKKYPFDIEKFYQSELRNGYERLNVKLIRDSANVIDFQPFVMQDTHDAEGELAAFEVYCWYLQYGYKPLYKTYKPQKWKS